MCSPAHRRIAVPSSCLCVCPQAISAFASLIFVVCVIAALAMYAWMDELGLPSFDARTSLRTELVEETQYRDL